jgi:hypothetical protein
MTLSEFKQIFFFEWAHRVLGRGIGVAFGLPLAYFMARGWVTKKLRSRLLFLFGLGGLQGVIGWWMVKSGLKEDLDHPRVSAYRFVDGPPSSPTKPLVRPFPPIIPPSSLHSLLTCLKACYTPWIRVCYLFGYPLDRHVPLRPSGLLYGGC